jgi:hypothetical protein
MTIQAKSSGESKRAIQGGTAHVKKETALAIYCWFCPPELPQESLEVPAGQA